MNDNELKPFRLAGGTALALHIGHRLSIDLDFFSSAPFSVRDLAKHLIDKYQFKGDFLEKNTLKGNIADIKIDCITHSYRQVGNPINTGSIRLYSIEDIAAMKLAAIVDNGTRLKDFIDIACLSTRLSLENMLQAYLQKYPETNLISVIKGLAYYEDINFKEPIMMLEGDYQWALIEQRISNMLIDEKKVFQNMPY